MLFRSQYGEDSFRVLEEAMIAKLAARQQVVLATGGGAVLRESNRIALKQSGNTVVYLRASVEDLVRRLRHDTQRPLLQDVDPAIRLRQLFSQRDPLYRAVADLVVDTGRSSVSAIAHLLAMQLELGNDLTSPSDPGRDAGASTDSA